MTAHTAPNPAPLRPVVALIAVLLLVHDVRALLTDPASVVTWVLIVVELFALFGLGLASLDDPPAPARPGQHTSRAAQ